MAYLIMGLLGVFAGIRALGLRRRQLSAGGAFLLLGGIVVLVRG
jgi:hypothetical protein